MRFNRVLSFALCVVLAFSPVMANARETDTGVVTAERLQEQGMPLYQESEAEDTAEESEANLTEGTEESGSNVSDETEQTVEEGTGETEEAIEEEPGKRVETAEEEAGETEEDANKTEEAAEESASETEATAEESTSETEEAAEESASETEETAEESASETEETAEESASEKEETAEEDANEKEATAEEDANETEGDVEEGASGTEEDAGEMGDNPGSEEAEDPDDSGKQTETLPEGSTVTAPEGYVTQNTYLDQQTRAAAEDEEKKNPRVLLIEDVDPWRSNANQVVLGAITEYDKVTTGEFLSVNLEDYGVVVFANDQPFATYENYAQFKEYLELFASIGGVIVFGACDAGWANGELIESLPGNVTKKNRYEHNNYVADPTHAIVTGVLTDNVVLKDESLYSDYCSHVSFDEASFPAGTTVILRESSTDGPTLIEYPLGQGRVIASGLTWEHNYIYWATNGYGDFAVTAMEDMFRYAIRVSSIDVDELHFLEEWRDRQKTHSIIVADADGDRTKLSVIQGAAVNIDGEEFVTDENGQVLYDKYGSRKVTIAAPGYREYKAEYQMRECTSRIFFLEKKGNDTRPYVTQVSASIGNGDNIDLRDQVLHFTEGGSKSVRLCLDGNWNGHGKGEFLLYQEAVNGAAGKYLRIRDDFRLVTSPGKHFKENIQVKLKMIAEDGTVSEPVSIHMVIDKAPSKEPAAGDNALAEGIQRFDWIDSHAVKSDNAIFTKLLTADMSISSELIPVEIACEHNDDGTITYKGVIGIKSGEGTKNILHSKKDEKDFTFESAWDTWKKEVKKFKKAGNFKTYFENLKRKYGREWHATKLRATNEVNLDIAGYLEITVDQGNKVVSSEGGIILGGSLERVIGQTFFAGPVPIYYEFRPGLEMELDGGVQIYNEGGFIIKPQFNADLSLPAISLEGGVGVRGVATLGLQGKGRLAVEFESDGTNTETSGSLELGGAIHAKVIFVVDYTWDFANTKIPLWGTGRMAERMAAGLPTDDAECTIASRAYLENTTPWNTWLAAPMDAQRSNVIRGTLQEGVMPDAMPRIERVGDRLVMLFLQDLGQRAIGNHTRLVYSVYEDGGWSEPRPVWESETADFFFDSEVRDGELYVAWQKSSADLSAGENPEELLSQAVENSEICFAVWDDAEGCFTQQQYITADQTADMLPSLAVGEKGVSVVWVSSEENDLFGGSGNYQINRTDIHSGEAGKKEVIGTADRYILELAAGNTGADLQVLYTVLNEENLAEMYCLDGGTVTSVETDSNPAGLEFMEDRFLWQAEGAVYQYDQDKQNGKLLAAAEDEGISSSFRYLDSGDTKAVIWSRAGGEDGSSAVCASICEAGKWSAPVMLLEGIEENITFFDAAVLSDGTYAVILNTAEYIGGEPQYTTLQFAFIEPNKDVELLLADAERPDWESGKQELLLWLQNNGTSAVSQVNVVVSGADAVYLDKTEEVALLPGESCCISEYLDVTDLTAEVTADVTVLSENDNIPENNSQSIALGQVDVSLGVDTYERDENVVFLFSMVNLSGTTANAALRIREDSADGIVLDVRNIGAITREERVQYLFSIEKDKINYDQEGRKTLFFSLDTLENDWNEEDNRYCYTVSRTAEEGDPDGEQHEIVEVMPQSVTFQEGEQVTLAAGAAGIQLHAVVSPQDTTVDYMEWSAENADIVHVDSEGYLTPLRPGTTTVHVTMENGVAASIRVVVDSEEHIHTEVIIPAVPATCTTDGLTEGTRCEVCGIVLRAQETVPATGHSYGEPVFHWANDYNSCTAEFTCTKCAESRSVDGQVTGIKTGVTTEAGEQVVYTVTVIWEGHEYTEKKEAVIPIDPPGETNTPVPPTNTTPPSSEPDKEPDPTVEPIVPTVSPEAPTGTGTPVPPSDQENSNDHTDSGQAGSSDEETYVQDVDNRALTAPNTGDFANIVSWIFIALAAMGAIKILLYWKQVKEENAEK